jgi:hypothetical protein
MLIEQFELEIGDVLQSKHNIVGISFLHLEVLRKIPDHRQFSRHRIL